jgi:hypothetical protein
MASIRKRHNKDGTTTYQVRWIQGGRGGDWQAEKFGDEPSAETFRTLVDAHGQQWPPGWVKGQGFVEEPAVPGDMPLADWAHRYVDRLTGIDERTRRDYKRDVDNHLSIMRHTEPSGRVVEATIGNINTDDVQDWVRARELVKHQGVPATLPDKMQYAKALAEKGRPLPRRSQRHPLRRPGSRAEAPHPRARPVAAAHHRRPRRCSRRRHRSHRPLRPLNHERPLHSPAKGPCRGRFVMPGLPGGAGAGVLVQALLH